MQEVCGYAFETQKAEIENYIHPELIKSVMKLKPSYHRGEENWLNKWTLKNLPDFYKCKYR